MPAIVDLVRASTGFGGAAGTNQDAVASPVDSDAAGSRPTAIFAMSLGAMVAYDWLRRYPGEIDGLVLVNGSVGGINPPWNRLRWFGLLSMARAMTATRVISREAHILAMVSAIHSGAASDVAGSWAKIAALRPVSRLNAIRQLTAAARFRPAFPPLVDHGLVLTSLGDRMVNPACSRQIAAGIGAELREHPTAGHDLPLDAPEWVVEQVAEWAASVPRPPGVTSGV